jgi:RsmE family RNA methyltransferase
MNLLLLKENEIQGNIARVSGRRAKHAKEWLNAKPGATIRAGLINGDTGKCLVVKVTDGLIEIEINLTDPPPPPRPMFLIMALPRPKAFGRILQTVTSLGIKKLAVCHSYKVEKAYWHSHQMDPGWIDRQIFLGLEQSGDTTWPEVTFHRRLKPFVEDQVTNLSKGFDPWIAHPYATRKLPTKNNNPVALAIGPEGGWIPYEIDLFQKHGFEAGSFGPHILKCETAIAAITGHMIWSAHV